MSAGLPATRLNCLNRVLRSAARLIGRVSKFDPISAHMRDVLHWLPLRQRIEFRGAVLVWYSLIGQAHAYLTDLCCPSHGWPFGMKRSPIGSLVTSKSGSDQKFSHKFFQQLKTTLFGHTGVGSTSE